MKNTVKKINKDQLAEMVADITKQVIRESFDLTPDGFDPEAGENDYNDVQNYPDTPSELVDEPFYDDFLSNPAENSFPSDEPEDGHYGDYDDPGNGYYGDDDDPSDTAAMEELLENKEKEDLIQRQDKLLNFITENWDNHANNLIK